jgi:uncharacterized membrane protein (UPF0127 family)
MKPLKSFILLEKPEDKLRNRLIILGFLLFIIIISYVMYGSVAYGLSKLENYSFQEAAYAPTVRLKTIEVDCAEKNKFKTYVVDGEMDKNKGLSVFSKIKNDEAMLFVFDTLDRYSFWMKDMKFPIDIVWLDQYGYVVDLKSDALVNTYPEVFEPKAESLYVLEFNAGIAQKMNIKIGDFCSFDLSTLK